MQIEVLIRVPDLSEEASKEEQEEKRLERIIAGKIEEDVKMSYKYEPYVLDLRDVVMYGRDGKEHTKVYLPYGILMLKANFALFKRVYEENTGKIAKSLNDFRL